MLKRHGLQALNIAKLILPGDIATRRRNEKVIRMGKSFSATGGAPINPPVVEKGTWRLLAGADRVSACLNENIPRIECLVVSGTASELEEVTLIENAMRRHSAAEQDAAIARMVKLHQSRYQEDAFPEIEEEREETEDEEAPEPKAPEPSQKPHPNKMKSEAIAKVAEATGKTHKAVKAAICRDKKAAEPKPATTAAEPDEQLVIDSMGLDVPADIRKQTALEHAGLSAMHRELVSLQSKLTRLEGEVGHQYQALKGSLHDAAVAAKSALPASVCPWCKLTKRRKGCPGCKGKGWLTVGERLAVTDERLLATGKDAGIWVDSKFMKLEKVA